VPRLITKIGLVCAAAWAVSGCSGAGPLLEKETYSTMFSNTSRMFDVSELMKADHHNDDASLGPSGPVAPEDLVTADGRCATPTAMVEAQSPSATPPADRPVGSLAGDVAGAPMPAAPPSASQVSAPPPDRLQPDGLTGGAFMPRVMGGVALGMTECQVVRRAGAPSNVAITARANAKPCSPMTVAAGRESIASPPAACRSSRACRCKRRRQSRNPGPSNLRPGQPGSRRGTFTFSDGSRRFQCLAGGKPFFLGSGKRLLGIRSRLGQ